MKDSFVLYTKIKDVLDALSNEQKGMLFQAILDHESGEEVEISDPVVKIAFIPIQQDLDANAKKWEETRKARSEAGKKSAEQRQSKADKKEQNPTKGTNVDFVEHNQTKATDNVNVNVNVDVNGIKDKHKHGTYKHVLLTDKEYDRLKEEFGGYADTAIQIVDDYCEKSGKRYKNYNLVIRDWGIREAKKKSQTQPLYNYDTLERLLANQ